ncbi:tetratricopeptide repeat protein [Ectothiorhodospira mobilis]|uniref:tetratricopeptide repeat protein n=1 Tax=Ectothiorhodospira mobilis TaxID=195064 RepID=UPI001903A4FF|nr:tetratricopeptide repeat protein [Ectothiorhodospira mobilis]
MSIPKPPFHLPILLLLLLAGGCSTAPYRWPQESAGGGGIPPQPEADAATPPEQRSQPAQRTPEQERVPTPMPAIARAPAEDAPAAGDEPPLPAVAALTRDADRQRRAGDLDAAAASLERGLRIAPRDPRLWQRLAQVRLEQGEARQAEELARRSLGLCGTNTALRIRNWEIIAGARRLQGDGESARRALERARGLRSGETG